MKVEELIKEYTQAKRMKKEYDFSKRITKFYMPYGEKCALVKSIVETTSFEDINGTKVYKRDTKNMLFVFTMHLIAYYTDVEISPETPLAVYDSLMESGIMNGLMIQIPEDEISILRGMVDMERDDLEVNSRSLLSFFEAKSEAIRIVTDKFFSVLERPEIQAKIDDLIKTNN